MIYETKTLFENVKTASVTAKKTEELMDSVKTNLGFINEEIKEKILLNSKELIFIAQNRLENTMAMKDSLSKVWSPNIKEMDLSHLPFQLKYNLGILESNANSLDELIELEKEHIEQLNNIIQLLN